MSSTNRFKGLMGTPEPSTKDAPPAASVTPAIAVVPDPVLDTSAAATAPVESTLTPTPAPESQEVPERKSKAKVQLNTQQPEELKNAVDKAAAYLSFTTGKKVTTTDVVERALRVYLDQLPEAARGN